MASIYGFKAFLIEESGAATVDWVVLAAACVALGLGVTNVVATEMSNLTQEVRAELRRDMSINPFDLEHSSLGNNGCTHFYLDPAADPGAADNPNTDTGCQVGGTSSDASDPDAPDDSTSYTALIESDDEDD